MSNTTDKQIADVMKSLQRLVEAAKEEGRNEALAEVRSLVGGDGGSVGSGGRKPSGNRGRKPAKKTAKRATKKTKSGKPRKNPWAGLTPAQRLERVNAIRRGRGLPEKKAL